MSLLVVRATCSLAGHKMLVPQAFWGCSSNACSLARQQFAPTGHRRWPQHHPCIPVASRGNQTDPGSRDPSRRKLCEGSPSGSLLHTCCHKPTACNDPIAAVLLLLLHLSLVCMCVADRCLPHTTPASAQVQALADCTALHAVRIPKCWGL